MFAALSKSPGMATLLAIAIVYPVLACAIVYPTPFADLREHINWGLHFPLYTWKHPPLQSWIAGLVALTGARDAWLYALVGQLLTLIGLYYLVRAAREFFDADSVWTALILVAGGVFFFAAVPTILLNADHLLFPLWAAVLYYALAAVLKDRWSDWLLLGVAAGLALLDKYSSVFLLISILIAILWIAELRRHVTNPKLFASLAVCGAIVSINVIPMMFHPEFLSYASAKAQGPGLRRLTSLLMFLWSLIAYLAPTLLVVLMLAYRKRGVRFVAPDTLAGRFVIVTTIGVLGLSVLVIALTGLRYVERYSHPIFAALVLSAVALVRVGPEARATCFKFAFGFMVAAVTFHFVYGSTALNTQLAEPGPALANILRTRWQERYSCGPAFLVGGSGQLAALYYSKHMTGLSQGDLRFAQWADRKELAGQGAIVVAQRRWIDDLDLEFPAHAATEFVTLPLRRTWTGRELEYAFYFVPPSQCSPSAAK